MRGMGVNPYESPKSPDRQQLPTAVLSDGKHCPACGEDIGVWPIASAFMPGHCRCPHCRARLAWDRAYRTTAVMLALTVVIAGAALTTVYRLEIEETWRQVAVYLAFGLTPVLIMGWIGAVYQRKYSKLRRA